MRVIFLDMDGVLNSEAFLLKLDVAHRALGHADPVRPKSETTCVCYRLERQVDDEAVGRLNRLIAATGAKVVISSSWRKLLDPAELLAILVNHGFVGEIIGETPRGDEPELRALYEYPQHYYRGYEIGFWLRQHPEVERFVILDDGSDMEMHTHRLVQTDAQEGLLDEHVDLAIAMLTSDDVKIPMPTRGKSLLWDKIGGHVVATVRLPEKLAAAMEMQFETLVYAISEGRWIADASSTLTSTEFDAHAMHAVTCARVRVKIAGPAV